MTTNTRPTLTSARPQGRFVTLTYTRLDGSAATLTVKAPVEHSMDAKVREPARRLTIFPEGDLPREFWVEADRIMAISETLASVPDTCEMCGRADALPLASRGDGLYCPTCATRAVLIDDAERSLKAQVGPALGAWAAQCMAAGLSLSDVTGTLDALTGSYLREEYRRPYIRTHLRRLMRAQRATQEAGRAAE